MYWDYDVHSADYLEELGTLLDEEDFEEPTDIGAVSILQNWHDAEQPPPF